MKDKLYIHKEMENDMHLPMVPTQQMLCSPAQNNHAHPGVWPGKISGIIC